MRALHFLLAGMLILTGCASATDEGSRFEGTAESVLGCYELTIGRWNTQPEEYMPPPVRFELTAEVGTDALENGRTLIGSRSGDPQNPFRWSWWDITSDPKLRLFFSTGFTGVTLEFDRQTGDGTFEGTARAFVDYSPETPTARAFLVRKTCS